MKRQLANLTVGFIVAVVAIGLVAVFAWAVTSNPTTQRLSGSSVEVSGCVIRFDPDRTGQPSIHANDSHYCPGVDKVGINSSTGRMRVTQNDDLAVLNPVIFVACQADETLTARGITCGPTRGTNDTEFQFYDSKLNRPLDLSKKSDRLRLAGKNSNAWLFWVHAPGATQ